MTLLFLSKLSIACIILCVVLLIRESNARPPWLKPGSGVFTESAECHTDDELLDLCQRCAKLTKAKQALSACCSTDMEARKWCSDYVYFGRGQFEVY
ncbi:uncharacterized protein LOC106136577 [Amyelois transitella]|uniref:uncharacterized protein LOC106136577 n=1 Tax=Amyelois transitella TaxID=680683 RepID=UPI00067CE891|nr:uncharacterized protein LOC106136577 [Amyelois transitella]